MSSSSFSWADSNTKNLPRSRSRARLDLVQELLGAGGAWRQRGHDGGARGRLLAVVLGVGFGFPPPIVVVIVAARRRRRGRRSGVSSRESADRLSLTLSYVLRTHLERRRRGVRGRAGERGEASMRRRTDCGCGRLRQRRRDRRTRHRRCRGRRQRRRRRRRCCQQRAAPPG